MTLETPYPIFIQLRENSVDEDNYVSNRWVYCKSISNYQGVASGQTEAEGFTSIEMQNICNNNDICQFYDGTFEYEFIVDTGKLPPQFYPFQNSYKTKDIALAHNDEDNDISIAADNYVKKDVNLKTLD